MKKLIVFSLLLLPLSVFADDPVSVTCGAGQFLPANATACASCPSGYMCGGGTYFVNATESQGLTQTTQYITTNVANACAANFGNNMYAVFEPVSVTCASGRFLPANSKVCATCPTGYVCGGGTYSFNPTKSQGLTQTTQYITTNVANVCAANFGDKIYAVFQPISVTCASGQFLPANSKVCATCPTGYVCGGGTFSFSPTKSQGYIQNTQFITNNVTNVCSANFGRKMYAVFRPVKYPCDPGQYMPAGTNVCATCPENNYCPGGSYPISETDDQGIFACDIGFVAPEGMWEEAQCGRRLFVGNDYMYLRQTRKTEHTYNVALGNQSQVFYGNMTTSEVPMNIDTTRKYKVKYNNVTYCVYDDTVNPSEP